MTDAQSRLTVLPRSHADVPSATALATKLALRCLEAAQDPDDLVLEVSTSGLALAFAGKQAPKPVRVDFEEPSLRRRIQRGGREALVHALRGKRTGELEILDATAGFGVDAFVAASRGLRVTMCERDPILVALLEDGLARARRVKAYAATLDRLQLVIGDSRHWIPQQTQVAPTHAIYLDPMFPKTHGKNSALPARAMQALRHLLGTDAWIDDGLLAIARAHSPRVVVKRPRTAIFLDNQEPTRQLLERSCRYDIYLQ